MGKFREYNSVVQEKAKGKGDVDTAKHYLKIEVRLDDTKVGVKRQEYTFDMLFIAIGGLERVWSRIFGMVVGAVSKPLMVNSFLGALFMMKNNRDKKPGQQGVVGDDSSDPEAENYHGHRPASGHRYVSEHNEATVYNASKKSLSSKDDISEYKRQKLYKNGV